MGDKEEKNLKNTIQLSPQHLAYFKKILLPLLLSLLSGIQFSMIELKNVLDAVAFLDSVFFLVITVYTVTEDSRRMTHF